MLGWQTAIAGSAFVNGGEFQSFIQLLNPDYEPQLWQGTLLYYAVLVFAVVVAIALGPSVSQLESTLLVLYFVGFVAVLVPFVYLAPHGSAQSVFAVFVNGGGWSTQGVSFFIGLSASAFNFLGADSIYHVGSERSQEEIKSNAITSDERRDPRCGQSRSTGNHHRHHDQWRAGNSIVNRTSVLRWGCRHHSEV